MFLMSFLNPNDTPRAASPSGSNTVSGILTPTTSVSAMEHDRLSAIFPCPEHNQVPSFTLSCLANEMDKIFTRSKHELDEGISIPNLVQVN